MDKAQLEALGIEKDALMEMVADRICESLLKQEDYDYDSEIEARVNKRVQAAIDQKVEEVWQASAAPLVQETLDNWVFQQTDRWGSKKAEPISLAEYIAQRCEAYISEEVNYDGRDRKEHSARSCGSFNKHGSRIGWMIDKHLQTSLQHAFEPVVASAHEIVVESIGKDIKNALAKAAANLKAAKVNITTPKR